MNRLITLAIASVALAVAALSGTAAEAAGWSSRTQLYSAPVQTYQVQPTRPQASAQRSYGIRALRPHFGGAFLGGGRFIGGGNSYTCDASTNTCSCTGDDDCNDLMGSSDCKVPIRCEESGSGSGYDVNCLCVWH